jgi:hypothetical protein
MEITFETSDFDFDSVLANENVQASLLNNFNELQVLKLPEKAGRAGITTGFIIKFLVPTIVGAVVKEAISPIIDQVKEKLGLRPFGRPHCKVYFGHSPKDPKLIYYNQPTSKIVDEVTKDIESGEVVRITFHSDYEIY